MKALATLLLTAALASTAIAGPISSKNPKAPVMPPPPAGCDCFAPGAAFGVVGGAILPSDGAYDDALGGGLLGEYFFTENIGIQGSYGVYATDSEHHAFDAALVLRAPIKSLCLAPYILAGGGFSTNAENEGNWLVGGGLDYRFNNCAGIFADGAYHFAENGDYTIVRLGVKFPF
jgi:hypothetical protein